MQQITELPEGFRKVSVVLTEKEFQQIRRDAALTGSGTYSAAIRQRLGWHETPYGIKTALRRKKESQK